ncbi:hypothetical protein REG_1645 [Candidatus Regiella insecticola LSR1]|uniref:Uncharacterized protein n=1 Tax=Candidatus Regiella insecticola LSR1 TaxID=663321 RepID=E0WU75_9ENTR|nr:hypothetical protein [Candidatus Regiella insecticola]EFL91441.1 hypothetical protein REG_1645 [Candidatus Regiella insecticola LSR1]
MVDNITQARLAGMHFNYLKQGFEQGGFTLIGNVLIPWQGAVIKAIHLENARAPTVVFDEIGAQIRKKTVRAKITSPMLMILRLISIYVS